MNAAASVRVLMVAFALLLCPPLRADEPTTQPDAIEPALPANPEVLQVIDGLGDNEWAQLPPATIRGEFNAITKRYGLQQRGPTSRDFCLKMAYAPDRQRALYCGANHGVPHKLNDVWEYDLASNTWVMLFAPDYDSRGIYGKDDYTDNAKLVFRDGTLMTENGNPVITTHTFSAMTYDPKTKLLLWMGNDNSHKTYLGDVAAAANKDAPKFKGPYLWAFDTVTRKWRHLKTAPPFPRFDPGAGFNYIPHLNKSLWSNNRRGPDMWLYDHAAKSWEELPAKGGYGQSARMSAQKVYDPDRKLLICHGGHSDYTSEYDLKTGAWTKTVEVDPAEKNAPKGADKLSTFAFDSVNGVALFCDNIGGYVWIYDAGLQPRKWVRLEPKNSKPDRRIEGGKSKGGKFTPMGFFHPAHNVLVLSNGGKEVWIYRYKRRAPDGGK